MKFKPEWVDAELEVNSDPNEAVNGSGDAVGVTEKLQEVETSDDVATITPTQAN